MRTGDWITLRVEDEDNYRVTINIDNIAWFNYEESIVTTNDGTQHYITKQSMKRLRDYLGFEEE